jgi:hypothetical protein
MTPDLMKRLIYSKYLFTRAKSLQQIGNELSSAEALLAAHDSVEMLMRVIMDHLGAAPKADRFMEFYKTVEERTGAEPPYESAMDRLNHLRVSFKHKGNLPHPDVVADLMPSVAAFCVESTDRYLGLKYEAVSLCDLVQDAEARDGVREAERAYSEGKVPDALLALGKAFDKLHGDACRTHSSALIQQGFSCRLDTVRILQNEHRRLEESLGLDQLRKLLQQVIDTVDVIILGIDPGRFRRFSDSTPLRSYSAFGDMMYGWQRDPQTLTSGDFDFCHQFVIEFALRLASSA